MYSCLLSNKTQSRLKYSRDVMEYFSSRAHAQIPSFTYRAIGNVIYRYLIRLVSALSAFLQNLICRNSKITNPPILLQNITLSCQTHYNKQTIHIIPKYKLLSNLFISRYLTVFLGKIGTQVVSITLDKLLGQQGNLDI